MCFYYSFLDPKAGNLGGLLPGRLLRRGNTSALAMIPKKENLIFKTTNTKITAWKAQLQTGTKAQTILRLKELYQIAEDFINKNFVSI